MPSKRLVISYGGPNPFNGVPKGSSMIEVHQRGENGHFTVRYGLSLKKKLTYAEACEEFGQAVFHLEACNGNLGNEGP